MSHRKSNNDENLQEWLEQYEAELKEQASDRSSAIESLLIAGNFDKIRKLLERWESEDRSHNSVRQEYNNLLAQKLIDHNNQKIQSLKANESTKGKKH
jgi:Spy/CpxP family protein refolding chaperone